MSDYLSNLAARSLGQVNQVRPRPVPLFAPPPRVVGWPPVEQADDLEFVAREQQPAVPHTPLSQVIAPQIDPQVLPQPTMPPLAPPIGESRLNLSIDHPAQSAVAHVAAPALRASEYQHQPTSERTTERMVVERLIAPTPATEQMIIERLIAPAPAHAVTPAEKAPVAPVVERIITSQVQPAPVTAVPQVALPSALAPIVVTPHVVPAPAPPAPPQASVQSASALPEPAPVIQVTIGRIEVRATPPPSQSTRGARQSGPAMGLDEYLRSRSGGSR